MKNRIFGALIACISLLLVSCNSEDEISIDRLVNHKWMTESTDVLLPDYGVSVQTERNTLYFFRDGTGILINRLLDKDSEFGQSIDSDAFRFDYMASGNSIILIFDDSSYNRHLTYSNDFLYDEDFEMVYERKDLSYDDVEYAKELMEEKEFQSSINHNSIQDFDFGVGFERTLYPVKSGSSYYWYVDSYCEMPKDAQRRGITEAGLVVYVDNGSVTNSIGWNSDEGYKLSTTTLDGNRAYYFAHVTSSDDGYNGWHSNISFKTSSSNVLTIHFALRYYDNVSKEYFTIGTFSKTLYGS